MGVPEMRDRNQSADHGGGRPDKVCTIDSGSAVTLGVVCAAVALLILDRVVGWAPTWRALGVTPLQPPFFDMHVINDYAACAWHGTDAYGPHACNGDNFNIPPVWLRHRGLWCVWHNSSLLS